jgi:alkylhydroperoxidase family enzyme
LAEERIAALDGDWSEYSEAERSAFALARKLTYEPHTVTAGDFQGLRKHYKDAQVLEIIFTIANNNSTTRWTEALGIPQEAHRTFLTPAAEKYRDRPSRVAPLRAVRVGTAAPAAVAPRPPREARAEVEAALDACRKRSPLLALAHEEDARRLLPPGGPAGPVPQWVRLLAHFPKAGAARVNGLLAAARKGNLDDLLKARINWIAARHDRAWYALGHAKRQLLTRGQTPDAIYALDGPWEQFPPKERLTFAFVRKLTVAPALIVDDDVARLRKHYTDSQVAELVYRVCNAAFFDRVTEACRLQLEH